MNTELIAKIEEDDQGLFEIRCPFCNALIASNEQKPEGCQHLIFVYNDGSIFYDNFYWTNAKVAEIISSLREKKDENDYCIDDEEIFDAINEEFPFLKEIQFTALSGSCSGTSFMIMDRFFFSN